MEETPPKNAYIFPPEEIADGVVFRLIVEDNNRIQMVLVIDENTDFEYINQHRKEIKGSLKFINEKQGSDLNKNYVDSIIGLSKWHDEGIGWNRLTRLLNYLCVVETIYSYEKFKQGKTFDQLGVLISNPGLQGGINPAIFSFIALGRSIDEFTEWQKIVFEDLYEGIGGIGLIDQPFVESQIKNKVRSLRQRIKKERIFPLDSEWNALEYEIYFFESTDKLIFDRVNELLDKKNVAGWRRNRDFIQDKIKDIIKKWEVSKEPKIVQFRELSKEGLRN
jgi:hypothetical protein